MLIKILGVIDLIIAFILLLLAGRVLIPKSVIIIVTLILAVKAIPAINLDIGSLFDVFAGIMIFLSGFFLMPRILLIIACFLLLQKGALSLLS